MNNFNDWILGTHDFPARWTCGHWTKLHGWTHIISDILVWAAYLMIPVILIHFILKRKDVPFPKVFWLFGAFIAACGTTHLIEAIIFWVPIYRISAGVKMLTALVSWATIFALIRIVPVALSFRSPEDLQKEIDMRIQKEEELRAKTKELEKFNEKLNVHIGQLETANKELDAFSYTVSHDLRSPLRAIDGFSKAILEDCADKLDDEGRRLLNVVRKNTLNMGQMIDELLAFSHLGRQEIKSAPLNMERIARDVCEELKVTLVDTVAVDIQALPPSKGDAKLIRQVFINLLSNAFKYTRTKQPAAVEVGGYSLDKENIYYVKDNGIGFEMQYVNKLFGVFQRLHPASEFEGTGVGLAIVRRVIERHGGRVWAEGKLDEGAVFYFALPNKNGG